MDSRRPELEDSVSDTAEETRNMLRSIGFAPSFTAYEDLGHGVSDEETRDVFHWLEGVV